MAAGGKSRLGREEETGRSDEVMVKADRRREGSTWQRRQPGCRGTRSCY